MAQCGEPGAGIREIISAVRGRCRADFILGLRLSPERFDLDLAEIRSWRRA